MILGAKLQLVLRPLDQILVPDLFVTEGRAGGEIVKDLRYVLPIDELIKCRHDKPSRLVFWQELFATTFALVQPRLFALSVFCD